MSKARRRHSPESKLRAIKRIQARRGGTSVSEACERVGIRRDDYYRWLRALNRDGKDAFAEKSRRPKKMARVTPEAVKAQVKAMARSGRYANPNRICEAMRAKGSRITTKTVIGILEDAGLYEFKTQTRIDGHVIKRKVMLGLPQSG